jgi:hypothetical protein
VFPPVAAIANFVRVFSAKAPARTRMCQCSARHRGGTTMAEKKKNCVETFLPLGFRHLFIPIANKQTGTYFN